MAKCGRVTEVYSRCCGYHRPVKNWNKGKVEEFKDRLEYHTGKAMTRATSAEAVKLAG